MEADSGNHPACEAAASKGGLVGQSPSSAGGSGSQAGVWQTTQLDSTIGDLQRGEPPTGGPCGVGAGGGGGGTGPGQEQQTPAGDDGKATAAVEKKKKRRPRTRVVPGIRIYCGTFVHSVKEDGIEVLQNWLLGVEGGKIVFSECSDGYQKILEKYKLKEFEKECVIKMDEGNFMMPGFVDCHTHVVPYLVSGLLMDVREDGDAAKTENLLERRRKKLTLIADDRIAIETFNKFIQHSLRQGITCASYNGSVIESAARLLTDSIVRCRQRALVGMEIFYGDNRDDTHMFMMIKAKDVVNHVIRKKSDLVEPCLVFSKPLPEWMAAKLVEMAKDMDIPIKTTIGDFPESELNVGLRNWIELGEKRLIRYHKKCGVLSTRSILVNCSLSTAQDLKLIAESGSSIVYCPSASLLNCTFSSLSKFTSRSITVGFGTDLTTSHCVSMLETIRRAVQCVVLNRRWPRSEVKPKEKRRNRKEEETEKEKNEKEEEEIRAAEDDSGKTEKSGKDDDEDEDEGDNDGEIVDVSLMRLFHIATLGGAAALGLDKKIGNFEVGKEFDAILVNPFTSNSRFMVLKNQDSILEILEKFLCVGDDRNIVEVFVKGERVI